MEFNYNRGGYERGSGLHRGDCVPRAITIATELPYQTVYDELKKRLEEKRLKSNEKRYYNIKPQRNKPHFGTDMRIAKQYLLDLGWKWQPTMGIGTGCKVHLKADELPKGRILCQVSNHVVAVIDGIINDTYDPSREGTRCVYGYFYKEENK